MTQASNGKQQSAFSRWLRTGRLPSAQAPDSVELKFNPWHDMEDGRFTFSGAGRYFGEGGARSASPALRVLGRDNARKLLIATKPKAEKPRTALSINVSDRRQGRGATGVQPKPSSPRSGTKPNPAAEFLGGLREGLYGVAEGTVESVYSALTTNPITTVRNTAGRIAQTIDAAIATEDTPARIQLSRAANAVANASARDLGRATGSVAGNVALAAAPGAALGKVSALRRARNAVPRTTFDPPQIGWVKETLDPKKASTRYNDAATGARRGQAPTVTRTMPDGSKRPVKFDGIESDYPIDRKLKVVNAPRARAQLLRQSQALKEHHLIGTWEFPDERQKIKALNLLRKMNVTNIKVRVVKP